MALCGIAMAPALSRIASHWSQALPVALATASVPMPARRRTSPEAFARTPRGAGLRAAGLLATGFIAAGFLAFGFPAAFFTAALRFVAMDPPGPRAASGRGAAGTATARRGG